MTLYRCPDCGLPISERVVAGVYVCSSNVCDWSSTFGRRCRRHLNPTHARDAHGRFARSNA